MFGNLTLCKARQGNAWNVEACYGMERKGNARHGIEFHGEAMQGMAWHGKER
jgi:hypothetical protein